jgi:hypothetical protein
MGGNAYVDVVMGRRFLCFWQDVRQWYVNGAQRTPRREFRFFRALHPEGSRILDM